MENTLRKSYFSEAEYLARLADQWNECRAAATGLVALDLCLDAEPVNGFIRLGIPRRGTADIEVDLKAGLSFIEDSSVDLIYSRHLWQCLTYEEGSTLMRECQRVLKVGGRIRIAVLDLDILVHRYTFDWRSQHWLQDSPWDQSIGSRGAMLNAAFRSLPYQYLYNEEDLRKALQESSFRNIARYQRCYSPEAALWDLEVLPEALLVLEGVK